ncbi:MAG: hypothetical protein IJW63_02700 [Lachnospiraceae bacterium]|nr:hypothetical protein [Lachnospiraceae bacterium]
METIKVLGVGFSCVDIVKMIEHSFVSFGGTTGNVITILSQLGYETRLLTADYSGELGDWYKRALEIRNITPIYFQKSNKRISVVVEEVNSTNGTHFFRTTCPRCGNSLINVILPSVEKVVGFRSQMEYCNLLFFDRFSAGINFLANANVDGWNVYEPNAFRMYGNLLNGCRAADIIKFSAERIPDRVCNQLLLDLESSMPQIVIVTMGKDGLRFCVKKDKEWGAWNYLSSRSSENVVDTAGAGDWLTAGFLHGLLSEYPVKQRIPEEKVIEKLQRAQTLATVACSYMGAQGILKDSNGIDLLRTITKCNFWRIQDSDIDDQLKCLVCGSTGIGK